MRMLLRNLTFKRIVSMFGFIDFVTSCSYCNSYIHLTVLALQEYNVTLNFYST